MKLDKILVIALSLILACGIIPLARLMILNDSLFYLYVFFKIWMFGVVPIAFFWLKLKEEHHK